MVGTVLGTLSGTREMLSENDDVGFPVMDTKDLTSYGGNVWWFRIQIKEIHREFTQLSAKRVVWRCMKWKMVPRHRCFLFRKMWVTAFTREVAVPTGLPRVLRMLWHSAHSSQRWNGFRSLDDSLVFHAFLRNRAKMYLDDPVNQLRRGSCWMWMNR